MCRFIASLTFIPRQSQQITMKTTTTRMHTTAALKGIALQQVFQGKRETFKIPGHFAYRYYHLFRPKYISIRNREENCCPLQLQARRTKNKSHITYHITVSWQRETIVGYHQFLLNPKLSLKPIPFLTFVI